MRAGLALLLLLSTMLGGNCQDTDSPQGEQTPSATTTVQTVQPSQLGSESPNLVVNVPFSDQLTIRTQMSCF